MPAEASEAHCWTVLCSRTRRKEQYYADRARALRRSELLRKVTEAVELDEDERSDEDVDLISKHPGVTRVLPTRGGVDRTHSMH